MDHGVDQAHQLLCCSDCSLGILAVFANPKSQD